MRLHLVVQRLGAQIGAHARNQRRMLDRLGQILVGAGIQAMHDVLQRGFRGHQDDRHVRQRSIGPNLPGDLEAIQLGHHHVEEHEVGQQRTNRLQRLLAVDRLRGLVAPARQARLQDLAVVRVVVDDQDERRIAHQPVRSSHSMTLASRARGLNGLVT